MGAGDKRVLEHFWSPTEALASPESFEDSVHSTRIQKQFCRLEGDQSGRLRGRGVLLIGMRGISASNSSGAPCEVSASVFCSKSVLVNFFFIRTQRFMSDHSTWAFLSGVQEKDRQNLEIPLNLAHSR